jgi:CotH kinase protein
MRTFSVFILCSASFILRSQVELDSTQLPIVFINTNFQPIPDEPKITAGMGIIDNGYNLYNHVTDTNFAYYGNIGIEQRGSISQQWWWWQKSYLLETRDILGADSTVVMLGMPEESDWVLYGPFSEATLMHNALTYELVRDMGYWAPRTRFCEMMIKTGLWWSYNGVYSMMENIKRDDNRVDIAKLDLDDNAGDSLTGGYIVAVDQNINTPDSGWFSTNPLNEDVFFTYKYPKGDVITIPQMNYIQSFVDSFETALSSPDFSDPETGFRKYLDQESFMDFFFIQELSKNIDAYKRSSYLYKDKINDGGKLHAGPHWDYNSAWKVGLFGCESFDSDTGWVYDMTCWVNSGFPVPFWWSRLLEDTTYANDLHCRWDMLRSSSLSNAHIESLIDSMATYIQEASERHYITFNIDTDFMTNIQSFKDWTFARLAWMDAHMPGTCWGAGVTSISQQTGVLFYPNPTDGSCRFNHDPTTGAPPRVTIFDVSGRICAEVTPDRIDAFTCTFDMTSMEPGVYMVQIFDGLRLRSGKIERLP